MNYHTFTQNNLIHAKDMFACAYIISVRMIDAWVKLFVEGQYGH